jgi:hypothetical protein
MKEKVLFLCRSYGAFGQRWFYFYHTVAPKELEKVPAGRTYGSKKAGQVAKAL